MKEVEAGELARDEESLSRTVMRRMIFYKNLLHEQVYITGHVYLLNMQISLKICECSFHYMLV